MFFEVKNIDETNKAYNLSHVVKNVRIKDDYLILSVINYEIFLLLNVAKLEERTFELKSDLMSSKCAVIITSHWLNKNIAAEFYIMEKTW